MQAKYLLWFRKFKLTTKKNPKNECVIHTTYSWHNMCTAQLGWNWAGSAVLFSRQLPAATFFFHIFSIGKIIKQNSFSLISLTLISLTIVGVNSVCSEIESGIYTLTFRIFFSILNIVIHYWWASIKQMTLFGQDFFLYCIS